MAALLWIVAAAVFGVVEIFTTTLFLMMLSVGALAAAGAAALGAGVPVQTGVFVVVSALTLVGVRPSLRRRMDTSDTVGMGVDAMRGAPAVVVEEVDGERGMVKIDGELWQARALESAEAYRPGERVRIVDVADGAVTVWRDDLAGIADSPH